MILSFTQDNVHIKINIKKSGHDNSWADIMACQDRNIKYEFTCDKTYNGDGIRGDDAIWIPFRKDVGLKIIANNSKYQSLEDCLESIKNIAYLQTKEQTIFPSIKTFDILEDEQTKNTYLLVIMENMGQPTNDINAPEYIPVYDKNNITRLLHRNVNNTVDIISDLTKLNLCPEDEWYKSINLVSGKIVDFHRFRYLPERYNLPCNNKTSEELDSIYKSMVQRYTAIKDQNGQPKWKGRIYQGFNFNNNYSMKGYTSAHNIYDSYFKLPFMPFNKVKDKKVLDIGSNQGFFCFQALIHGASKAVGIEYTEQDVLAAEDIKAITGLENANFIHGDGVEYVMNTNENYELVILNSVLHQIYPNLINADDFMLKLSSMTKYLAFETPLNHPKMSVSVDKVQAFLSKYFKIVRLINTYDAYSSGYRANFVCYS